MKLKPNETVLTGSWNFDGKVNKADDVCDRIKWLLAESLTRIGTDDSGWETLYQDPDDKRYWELVYPNSEMHGGGPPQLRNLSDAEARSKYKLA